MRDHPASLDDLVEGFYLLTRRSAEREDGGWSAPPVTNTLIQFEGPRDAIRPVKPKLAEVRRGAGFKLERPLPPQATATRFERFHEERLTCAIILPRIADRPLVMNRVSAAPQVPREHSKGGPEVGPLAAHQVEQHFAYEQQSPRSRDIAIRIAHFPYWVAFFELVSQRAAIALNDGPKPRTESFYASVEFLADGEHRYRTFGLGAKLVDSHCGGSDLREWSANPCIDEPPIFRGLSPSVVHRRRSLVQPRPPDGRLSSSRFGNHHAVLRVGRWRCGTVHFNPALPGRYQGGQRMAGSIVEASPSLRCDEQANQTAVIDPSKHLPVQGEPLHIPGVGIAAHPESDLFYPRLPRSFCEMSIQRPRWYPGVRPEEP